MRNILKITAVIILVFISFNIVQLYNLNGFQLAHLKENITKVNRDSKEKYNGEWSYKIESLDYNDYMIYKTIKVKRNTAYKVSCMVKTKDVIPQDKRSAGFSIGLKDDLEKSRSILGTNDWQELSFYFDSKNNETIDIAFRLGDSNQNCKGTAWFSNIKIEVGRKTKTNNWNFAVFMINNTELNIGAEKVSEKLSLPQSNAIKNAFVSFKQTLEDFSYNNMDVNYDIISIDEPLKTISYDDETGYYISTEDCQGLIDKFVYGDKQYDHIFIVANIGDKIKTSEIEWIGLGGMLYDNIGFSNIRISNESMKLYMNSYYNYFPEEIIIHEFLHTLERNSGRFDYETIALHDFADYGYKNESRYGLKKWYRDYIRNNIKNTENGIRKEVYYSQPVCEKNFKKREDVTTVIYESQNLLQKINEGISKIL